jgi:hypothetical protein
MKLSLLLTVMKHVGATSRVNTEQKSSASETFPSSFIRDCYVDLYLLSAFVSETSENQDQLSTKECILKIRAYHLSTLFRSYNLLSPSVYTKWQFPKRFTDESSVRISYFIYQLHISNPLTHCIDYDSVAYIIFTCDSCHQIACFKAMKGL